MGIMREVGAPGGLEEQSMCVDISKEFANALMQLKFKLKRVFCSLFFFSWLLSVLFHP